MNPKASKITTTAFLKTFKSFEKKDQLLIARKINQELFDNLWKELDSELPNIAIPEIDILNEIKAERYGSKKGSDCH